ncbi:MAG: hypothetical protein V8S58_17740 [Lachnospiraceae bacterium]
MSELLETYHLEEHQAETKEWYDGYHIGGADVYCPWDVINHVDRLCGEPGRSRHPTGSIPAGMIW